MKRDMDLIKLLLESVEKSASSACVIPEPSDFPEPIRPTEEDLGEHCRLLVERGLVRGEPTFSGWVLTGLTRDGHDFLDNSREAKVWNTAKKAAGSFSFGVFMKVLVETATRYAMSRIENV